MRPTPGMCRPTLKVSAPTSPERSAIPLILPVHGETQAKHWKRCDSLLAPKDSGVWPRHATLQCQCPCNDRRLKQAQHPAEPHLCSVPGMPILPSLPKGLLPPLGDAESSSEPPADRAAVAAGTLICRCERSRTGVSGGEDGRHSIRGRSEQGAACSQLCRYDHVDASTPKHNGTHHLLAQLLEGGQPAHRLRHRHLQRGVGAWMQPADCSVSKECTTAWRQSRPCWVMVAATQLDAECCVPSLTFPHSPYLPGGATPGGTHP